MTVTEKDLRDFTGAEIIIADRSNFESEKNYARDSNPKFSIEERWEQNVEYSILAESLNFQSCNLPNIPNRELRKAFAISQNVINKTIQEAPWPILDSHAFAYSRPLPGLSEQAKKIGEAILGKKFPSYFRTHYTVQKGIIFDGSNHLSINDYWKRLANVSGVARFSTSLDDIIRWHEGSHFLAMYDDQDKQRNPDYLLYSEGIPDAYGTITSLDKGGLKSNVDDFIAARTLASFTDGRSPAHYTASVIHAAMNRKPLPSYNDASRPIKELRFHVVPKISPFAKAWEKQSLTFSTLADVIDKKRNALPIETIDAGNDIIKAYERLCPDEDLVKESYEETPVAHEPKKEQKPKPRTVCVASNFSSAFRSIGQASYNQTSRSRIAVCVP
jgi:hypothetical protein